jgi:hypothetical protein
MTGPGSSGLPEAAERPPRTAIAADLSPAVPIAGFFAQPLEPSKLGGRSKRTDELTSSMVPRGTPFHRVVADYIVQPAIGAGDEEQSTIRLRSQPGIIKGQLPAWIDIIFRAASRRPVELINVAYVLVRGEPAGLAGAIGEDQDILGHVVPAASDPFCDLKRIHSDPESSLH